MSWLWTLSAALKKKKPTKRPLFSGPDMFTMICSLLTGSVSGKMNSQTSTSTESHNPTVKNTRGDCVDYGSLILSAHLSLLTSSPQSVACWDQCTPTEAKEHDPRG